MNPKTSQRLRQFRDDMTNHEVGIALIRSTDQFLNEYVPLEQSRRAYYTGFTGSVGDAVITQDKAILFVDGRYTLQAQMEATEFEVHTIPLTQSIETAWLEALNGFTNLAIKKLAVEYDRVPVALFERLQKRAHELGLILADSFLASAPEASNARLRVVERSITGQSVEERLETIAPLLAQHNLGAFFVTPLDEIAWMSNLRGADFPYQATFAARGLLFSDDFWVIGSADHAQWAKEQRLEPGVSFMTDKQFSLPQRQSSKTTAFRIGIDPETTPQASANQLRATGAEIIYLASPLKAMKAKKTQEELRHMRESFARADRVVFETQTWLCDEVSAGNTVSEADVDDFVRQAFERSGTTGLSFKPICAAGKNGAIIHYGHPDPKRIVKKGELFLLDTGGLYEGGYATDLTRTFLVGDQSTQADPQQKRLFTLTLKGAIAGMSARFLKGTTGGQLDVVVREPIQQAGYNYGHGTGHGVGINVHEGPPRISTGSQTVIEIGHVFSIEPGIYLPEFGGIRIENLCTVVQDAENSDYLRVLPLTFAPLDGRLIDVAMLTPAEIKFLAYFAAGFQLSDQEMPPTP